MKKPSKTKVLYQDVEKKLADTVPASDGSDIELEEIVEAAVTSPLAKSASVIKHEVDAGMVEVSVGLASLVSAAATIGTGFLDQPNRFIAAGLSALFLSLVLLSNFAALWFLASYCVSKNLFGVDEDHPWHQEPWRDPRVVRDLLTCYTGIYSLLAWCHIFLVGMFFTVLLFAIWNLPSA